MQYKNYCCVSQSHQHFPPLNTNKIIMSIYLESRTTRARILCVSSCASSSLLLPYGGLTPSLSCRRPSDLHCRTHCHRRRSRCCPRSRRHCILKQKKNRQNCKNIKIMIILDVVVNLCGYLCGYRLERKCVLLNL